MARADKPNLVVIMADDLGYADVGFNGCEDIPTPHIDSIAADGVKFTNGYVSYAVCGPSRAGFITGRYEQRFGFERNPQYRPDDPKMGLPTEETTIANSLGKVGYRCGVVGKWHLGANDVHHPLERGFHQFFGHLGGGHRYMPEELTIKESTAATGEAESYRTWILNNHTPVKPTKYLTDQFSDAAVTFVSSNKDKPFFLFLSYNAPHTPLQATTEYLNRFPDITDKKRKTYAAMVSAVDDGVGRVLGKLREFKMEDNTLVFFLSDNGGPTTKNASRNTPLKGDKGSAWEGGYRVPFAARWPGGLPKGKAYRQPVSSLDIFATIAALSGAPIDPQRPLDGVNLVPYVTGKKIGPPHEAIYLRMFDSQKYAIRSGDHKLVIPARNVKPQLYNVTADVSESTNLASGNPEILDELKQNLDAWTRGLVEPRFPGLIHTPAYQNRAKKAKAK
ncbi:MAG: sulfatase-like hydrolase/transferase [Fuerstiella sp.]|nr:sulfatase-like hydrolase/transferase [Fuerstiella sp.]MCP4855312.1 sulfatase-like hydrolase/transferase [Fuerstiella sp.]